jgi:hypothetical protein
MLLILATWEAKDLREIGRRFQISLGQKKKKFQEKKSGVVTTVGRVK